MFKNSNLGFLSFHSDGTELVFASQPVVPDDPMSRFRPSPQGPRSPARGHGSPLSGIPYGDNMRLSDAARR